MDLTQVCLALGIPGIGIVCWAVTSIVDSWQESRRVESQMALKQQMIERGLAADEIERVLRAGDPEAVPASVVPRAEGTPQELGQLLAEHGVEADDMVKVLRAAHGATPLALATARGMIEHGYAADDIVKVLAASPGRETPLTTAIEGRSWRQVADVNG